MKRSHMARSASDTGAPARGPSKREQLRAARETHLALRALAALSDLQSFLSPDALGHPRKLISEFATGHHVPGWETPAKLAQFEQLPEKLDLDREGPEGLRRAILEAGAYHAQAHPDHEAQARAGWCFQALDYDAQRELVDAAPDVARGMPATAVLAEIRVTRERRRRIADTAARKVRAFSGKRPRGRLLEPTTADDLRAIEVAVPLVAADDPQVVRLEAFRRIVHLPSGSPAENAGWMARWLFRDRPDCEELASVAWWLRYFVDFLREAADGALARRSEDLLRRFLEPTALSGAHRADVHALGLAPVKVPHHGVEAPVAEVIPVALAGRSEAVHQALREAGLAALDWPWVRRGVEAWRAVAIDESSSGPEREGAAERLHGVGRALAVGVGQGRLQDPKRAEAGRLRPILIGYCRALRREKRGERTPVPPELLEAGLTEATLRREGALSLWTPVKAAGAILQKHFELASERSAQRAATETRQKKKG